MLFCYNVKDYGGLSLLCPEGAHLWETDPITGVLWAPGMQHHESFWAAHSPKEQRSGVICVLLRHGGALPKSREELPAGRTGNMRERDNVQPGFTESGCGIGCDFSLKQKIRWGMVFYDLLVYLLAALFILVIYPSSINVLTPLEIVINIVVQWACIFLFRMVFHLYKKIWRYAGPMEYISLIISDGLATVVFLLIRPLIPNNVTFVRAISLMMSSLLGCIAIRYAYQWIYLKRGKETKTEKFFLRLLQILTGTSFANEKTNTNRIRIAIIGAGSVGAMLADELIQNPRATYEPVCFVDVDEGKVGREIYGVRVLSSNANLADSLNSKGVQEVVFALPAVSTERKRELYEKYKGLGYKIKSYDYPTFGEEGKRVLHDFEIEDLLFRAQASFLTEETKAYYKGKAVMITGGGGSIGSELARQIASCEPSRLVLLDIYENGAYDVQQELIRKNPNLNLRVEIANICDREAIDKIFRDHTPDIVLHAAAHKHVPLMERNVMEAVRNNIFGTLNVVETCEKYNVGRFIMISTDKAVNPTNVMGATKRMCEMMILSRRNGPTKYSATRFGNVLGSNGSVIPLFKKQIASGGPVTITDKRIIRYFMTIPEASQLVMTSGAMAKNGELYVLDMGNPVKIWNLAENMIRMSGLEPGKDIQIIETGLRPGEKLYEELLVKSEELGKTENEKIFIEKDAPLTSQEIKEKLEALREALQSKSNRVVKQALKAVVPTYRAPEEINEKV